MIEIKKQEIERDSEIYADELRKSNLFTEEQIQVIKKIAYDSLIKSYETPVQIFKIVP